MAPVRSRKIDPAPGAASSVPSLTPCLQVRNRRRGGSNWTASQKPYNEQCKPVESIRLTYRAVPSESCKVCIDCPTCTLLHACNPFGLSIWSVRFL